MICYRARQRANDVYDRLVPGDMDDDFIQSRLLSTPKSLHTTIVAHWIASQN